MTGLDERLADLVGAGSSLAVVLAVALALGLRHATDPDHLAAVSTLMATEPDSGRRKAVRLGLAWGLGHATTLMAFGLPIVLFRGYLPSAAQHAAELLVGLMIAALAVRLLARWRAGAFHVHEHRHGSTRHRHLHPHKPSTTLRKGSDPFLSHVHAHEPEKRLGRTSRQAYGIGVVHGIGGSAGIGVLLLAAIPDHVEAVAALVLFAGAAALSMALLSSAFGYVLTRRPAPALTPALGVMSLLFGAWYALGAVGAA
jgi:ABC-type nickel/cobalt efflux system permease component RcnA